MRKQLKQGVHKASTTERKQRYKYRQGELRGGWCGLSRLRGAKCTQGRARLEV